MHTLIDEILEETPAWHQPVHNAIANGLRDSNRLANIAFFALHPGRNGRPISKSEPNFRQLARTWLNLRSAIRRMLRPTVKSPYPQVNTLMPKQGPGYYCRMPSRRRWALPETVAAIKSVAANWHRRYPTGPRFYISDISRRGGGPLCFSNSRCHKSHQVGLDLDVRLIRRDGHETEEAISFKSKAYSRERTRELIELFLGNSELPVKRIGFLDPIISGALTKVSPWAGHSHHFHVRFCMPQKYRGSLKLSQTYSGRPPNYRC